jgi:haloacetate dehalogenase
VRSDLLPGAVHREVAVDGVRFALYRADPDPEPAGAGNPPVLLLHGMPQTACMWHDLLPELARDRVVLAPDLKGLGRSEMRGPYDPATLVDELAALVVHEVDDRVDVVGHDWGGSLAVALAAHRPELVRRLVVCNAAYRYVDLRRAWHVPLFALPLLPEALFTIAGRDLAGRMIRAGWRGPRPLPEVYAEQYREAYAAPARRSAMLAYYRAAARPRVRRALADAAASVRSGRLPAVGRPAPAGERRRPQPERTLVVWGVRDPVLPLSVANSVVRDVGGEVSLLEVADAGHFVVEEAPQTVVPAVAAFLRGGGPGGDGS